MKKANLYCLLAGLILIMGCTSEGVNFSKSLFQHIPDDPELLVLVKPNDLANLTELAVKELPLDQLLQGLEIEAEYITTFQTMAVGALEAVGIPWENVESVGFLLYYKKPVLISEKKRFPPRWMKLASKRKPAAFTSTFTTIGKSI